ncbi:MAG: thiamine diphosphokinase [Acidimicrobiales bacterium]
MDANVGTVIVVGGGDALDPSVHELLPDADLVIAADAGVDHAARIGLHVDVAVGDFDSVTAAGLQAAVAAGAHVERHATDKDAIDLELAFHAARHAGADRVVVVGLDGGRLDLFVANLLLLASPDFADLAVEAIIGEAHVFVIRNELTISGRPGDLLSLLPVNGLARAVTTEGLRYPLHAEDLPAGTSRGCSNEFLSPVARVTIEAGTLLAIVPGATR